MDGRQASAAPAVGFGEAFRFWLKLGFISFGGPAGQISIMHRELVLERRWISEGRFLHALNYCMLLPGPEAQQLATYIGWLLHRTRGGLAAGLLFVLPSLLILVGLSWIYMAWGHLNWIAALFWGVKPAVAAIVLHALVRIGKRTLRDPREAPLPWAVASGSFVALVGFDLGFPWIVLAAALIGWLSLRFAPAQFAAPAAPAAPPGRPSGTAAKASIDDDTPPPPHARFCRARMMRVLLAGALLWLVPMAALVGAFGGAMRMFDHPLVRMGWFFSKAALVTFGGAYAVLPYVFQNAVERHGWLSSAQMIDGLALGETTPGPLIMVVAFVGFAGGWNGALLGPDARFLGGALAALVATWFTFLPSFVFIFAGGPLVEATRGRHRFTAPLAAVTAAVVGVIASLALFFIVQVARPAGSAGVDIAALLVLLAAAVALLRFEWSVIAVVAFGAVCGLVLRGLGPVAFG